MKNSTPCYLFCLMSASANVFAGNTGFVTPAEVTITFTQAMLVKSDNTRSGVLPTGTYPMTFKKTDTDFAAVSLGAAGVDPGRYIGVQICYSSTRSVKLNGDTYVGPNGSGAGAIANNSPIWSVGSTATAANSVSTTSTANPTTLGGFTIGNGSNQCSQSSFNAPLCITADGTGCTAGDTVFNTTTTPPSLNVLLDLYHSVGVDADTASLDTHVPIYPYPTFGTPGAAVHLKMASGANVGNVSLIFGSDGKLVYSSAYQVGGNTGFCSAGGGVSAVTVTAGPAGAFINAYGPTFVQKVTAGKVEFVAGTCGSGTNCTSNGLLTIDNFKQAVGSTTGVHCEPDATGALGYTYTGSSAAPTAVGTINVVRIVDPNNLLGGICTTSGGSCGTY